jgi:hypothetical protein
MNAATTVLRELCFVLKRQKEETVLLAVRKCKLREMRKGGINGRCALCRKEEKDKTLIAKEAERQRGKYLN